MRVWGSVQPLSLYVVVALLAVGGVLAHKKVHHNAKDNVAPKHESKKESVSRFTIPKPNHHPRSELLPEAIGKSVGSERSQIIGTELPGAYGEDYDMENMESGSGDASGSGASGAIEQDSESPESPGKFGPTLVHNPLPSNPSAAFMGSEKEKEEDSSEDVNGGLDADANNEDKKEEKNEDSEDSGHEAATATKEEDAESDKDDESEKDKSSSVKSKHAKPESTHKKKTSGGRGGEKEHEETNMISKIDAIAKQIEKVEHREKLNKKEAATLKVAKKVAKKVVSTIHEKQKKQKKVHHHKRVHKVIEDNAVQEKEIKHEKEVSSAKEEPKGPEGFECPWACFWTCHSYCPKECCNNPFRCDMACREFCTPYCSDRCCAPGSQRLPKLQINFSTPDDQARQNISNLFAEDDKHQLKGNVTLPPVQENTLDKEDSRLHTRLDPAENSYQQMKEHEHQIALTNQMEALKKATSYAAQLMGLPVDCPLACARICLPGLCKQQCCSRSQIPPANLQQQLAAQQAASLNPLLASKLNNPMLPEFDNKIALAKQYALARKQQYLAAHKGLAGMFAPRPLPPAAFANKNAAAAMNKLALQNQLFGGNTDFVPALARYRALQYVNQLNRQQMIKENIQQQLSRKQNAMRRCQPGYPCQGLSPQQQQHTASAIRLPNCPPICRSSCIPQCPNECCAHSTASANRPAAPV